MNKAREKARLEERYVSELRAKLKEQLKLGNVMEVPKLLKVVLNIGVKEAVGDSKALQAAADVLEKISGQKPVRTLARKSIASFKLREGMAIGVKVTLRKRAMYEFFDRFITVALPKVRDFQGLPSKMDGRGGYNIGIKEWSIFPEVDQEVGERVSGLNITVLTSAKRDEHGLELLKGLGVPFRKV